MKSLLLLLFFFFRSHFHHFVLFPHRPFLLLLLVLVLPLHPLLSHLQLVQGNLFDKSSEKKKRNKQKRFQTTPSKKEKEKKKKEKEERKKKTFVCKILFSRDIPFRITFRHPPRDPHHRTHTTSFHFLSLSFSFSFSFFATKRRKKKGVRPNKRDNKERKKGHQKTNFGGFFSALFRFSFLKREKERKKFREESGEMLCCPAEKEEASTRLLSEPVLKNRKIVVTGFPGVGMFFLFFFFSLFFVFFFFPPTHVLCFFFFFLFCFRLSVELFSLSFCGFLSYFAFSFLCLPFFDFSSFKGKSCVVIQFVENHFTQSYNPTIAASFHKTFKLRGQEFHCEILDTAGQVSLFKFESFLKI